MTRYRERLWPAPWIYVATALVIPASLLVFLPIDTTAGVVVAILLYVAIVAVLVLTTPVVEVTGTELRAGRATLPLAVVGEVTWSTGADATLERGRRLDARAWLLIRGWISPVVRVALTDPDDPTPYWLLSSRRPEELTDALRATEN